MNQAFDRLFSLTRDAAFLDLDGTVIGANQAALDLYGQSREEIVGRAVADLVPSEFHEMIAKREARVQAGEERARENRQAILMADGSTKAVLVRSAPIDYDGQRCTLVLLRPVDSSERSNDALGREQRRQQTFTDVSLQLATASPEDLDRTIRRVLGTIAATEGADRSYVIEFSDDARTLSCVHEWCAEGIDAQIDYVQDLDTADFPWSAGLVRQNRVVHVPDLSTLPDEARSERDSFGQFGVRSVVQVPMMVSGNVTGLIGFNSLFRNVTWPDETIEVLRRVGQAVATAMLRRRALDAIEQARAAAEEASRAKNTFLSRMSHELRTPLNAVLGFTELLLLDENRSDTDRQALDRVLDSGRHLLTLVEDVLDISRIEAGGLSLSMESVDLGATVDSAVRLLRDAGVCADRTLEIQIDDDAGHVRADRQRLQQVLMNLLSNGCKYNRPGGSVSVTAVRHDDRIRVAVADTGIGIPADAIARVFEPFDRLGRENSAVEGAGVGLALTKMIVEMMGGEIEIESTENVGTTITFTLVPTLTASSPTEAAAPTPVGSGVILGVEDNEASAILLRHVVESDSDLQFVGTDTVAGAIELARRHHPALVLLDLHLADGNGEEVIAALRAERSTREIPIVVVTADPGREVMNRVIAAGAVDFLPKPVSVDRLREAIRQYTN